MTIDQLARITQEEFLAVRSEMGGIAGQMATKNDLHELEERMRGETAKILQSVDTILVRFDNAEKDHAADKLLHDRHETAIEHHEQRITTLEKIKH